MRTDRIALLGWKDELTNAVQDYCRYLGNASGCTTSTSEAVRVPSEIRGWPYALRALGLKPSSGTVLLFLFSTRLFASPPPEDSGRLSKSAICLVRSKICGLPRGSARDSAIQVNLETAETSNQTRSCPGLGETFAALTTILLA